MRIQITSSLSAATELVIRSSVDRAGISTFQERSVLTASASSDADTAPPAARSRRNSFRRSWVFSSNDP